jgi:hypothetical protein
MKMSLRFHACPPSASWWNDPNALFHDGKTYRLLAQQRDDGPDFVRTGWGGAASADLLHWTPTGVEIAADAAGDAYSGSVQHGDAGWAVWHTVNAEDGQYQVRRMALPTGAWSPPVERLGPPRPDWRDPFVFAVPGDDRAWMLLAVPCAWDDPGGAQSTVEVYRNAADGWHLAGTIGPWHPAGILWEVPLLLPDPGDPARWLLILSLMDRRGGATRCSVRRWRGCFADGHFERDDPADDAGQPVDDGPDFYAAMANVQHGWPRQEPSWETARRMDWPGFAGGPISLPRRITAQGSAPVDALVAAFSQPAGYVPVAGLGTAALPPGDLRLDIIGDGARFSLSVDADGSWRAAREAPPPFAWAADSGTRGRLAGSAAQLSLFVDGPLIEVHLAPHDRWFTCALPGQGPVPLDCMLSVDGAPQPLIWHSLPSR